MLRFVKWCNVWNRAAAYNHDVGSLVHLSEQGTTGKTLCGREYPADKGHSAGGKVCKRCKQIAKNRNLGNANEWVPSVEYN